MVSDSVSVISEKKIVIIGAGNVATNLSRKLDSVANVCQIFSRTEQNAKLLADSLSNCGYTCNPNEVITNADFYIIAVSDDAIEQIANNIPVTGGIWAHTSGSVPMDALNSKPNFGVFYPLQTFRKTVLANFNRIHFFIEGSSSENAHKLKLLAEEISNNVFDADTKLRQHLHLAAVFACNFANYMWLVADRILNNDGLDISVFKSLLETTLSNAILESPRNSQTGPARRYDTSTIKKQLSELSASDAEIYRVLTEKIIEEYFPKNKLPNE